MGAKVRLHFEWVRSRLKNGKPGQRMLLSHTADYCPVERCEDCGKLGSPTWIKQWFLRPYKPYDLRMKVNEVWMPDPVLCIGCMNRKRPLWKAQELIIQNQRLINRIKREASRVRSQNSR